ncbi:unnamed protein product [Clonostachys rhizophaga]|uniref:Potassium channel domain-containing protein n=1 Tax=Clonostachys rhizophaga TaxID=160324 RepID=A0A9N9V3P6_9HYPO|nr:unnamed protein product [Clonostachys rhizophaga]
MQAESPPLDLGDHGRLPREYRIQNDEAHLMPSRWWFASSAFPMIAGTLGPVASAFSICALVVPWRQHLAPREDISKATYINDPPWLLAINAIQLALALVANVFLLLNMARRVRFGIAQPITMLGWYISAILLIALLAAGPGPLHQNLGFPADQMIWSQALWYGTWAAILYFLNASFMVVTFLGARAGYYPKDFNLTKSQRTLMLQTIMFLFYLLLGALIFSKIEGWGYLDALYWADVTLFTVGFGDLSPSTSLGRALLIPYSLVGIISLGLVIASIRSMILERGRRRVEARMEEKKRCRTVRRMTLKGDDFILNPISERDPTSPSVPPSSTESTQLENIPSSEYERRKAEFQLMRKIQDQAHVRRRWIAMGISTGSWLVLWLVGALIFHKCEERYQGWSYFDGFYFCYVSFTTVGYGDYTPQSNAGKSFFVFWSLLTLPTMTVLISNAGDTVVKFVRDATLRLGNITILPGDDRFLGELKYAANRLTLGRCFPDYIQPVLDPRNDLSGNFDGHSDLESAGELSPDQQVEAMKRGRMHPSSLDKDTEGCGEAESQPDGPAYAGSTFTSKVRRSLSRLRDPLQDLPAGTDFHFLLISEIQVVSRHLRRKEPRRYTFEEWAWYLRLIGEDERDPSSHGKPRANPLNPSPDGTVRHHVTHLRKGRRRRRREKVRDVGAEGVAVPTLDQSDQLKWSWVGHRSPLMGSQEESEWILDRLTCRLRESLSAERRRQLNRRPVGPNQLARRYGRDVPPPRQ